MKRGEVSNLMSNVSISVRISAVYYLSMDKEESVIEAGLNNKHHAVIAVGCLLGVLAVISGVYWYMHRDSSPATVLNTSTSTEPIATATSFVATTTDKLSITDHSTYYDVDATYPASTGLSGTNDAKAIALMKSFITDRIAQFKKDGNFANLTPDDVQMQRLDESKYSLSISYEKYTGARTISYLYTIFEDTHGAHPNTYYKTFTFDTSSGASLSLKDLFTSPTYLEKISAKVRIDLPAIIRKMSNSESIDMNSIDIGTKPQPNNFQNFVIDGSTIRIIFPPYQVGPYVLGSVVDPIPLSAFKAILQTKYIP